VWFALWSVLVAGAIVVPVLLGVGLWRRTKELGREVSAFAGAFDIGQLDVEVPRFRPTLLDPGTTARVGADLRANRAVRSARHAATLDGAVDRWRRLGLL
jgi:hypothetical protein